MPFVTVIIPVFKVEKYLNQCVNSVLQQEFEDIEVILVNDGSPDSCPGICNEYAKKDIRVKVIHKENGGLSSARNSGIQMAKGDYLMFLDSDDWWNEQASLQQLIDEVHRKPETEMFLFNSIDYHAKLGYLKRNDHSHFDTLQDITPVEFYERLVRSGNVHESVCTKIISKKFIMKHQLYFQEGLLGEDTEWFFRCMRCIKKLDVIDIDFFICRNQREDSITNTIGLKNVKDILRVIQQSIDYYDKTTAANERIKLCELAQCAYLWFIALSSYPLLQKDERELIKSQIEEVSWVIKHTKSTKTKLAYHCYTVFGIELTSRMLAMYVYLMKKNIIPCKQRVSNGYQEN